MPVLQLPPLAHLAPFALGLDHAYPLVAYRVLMSRALSSQSLRSLAFRIRFQPCASTLRHLAHPSSPTIPPSTALPLSPAFQAHSCLPIRLFRFLSTEPHFLLSVSIALSSLSNTLIWPLGLMAVILVSLLHAHFFFAALPDLPDPPASRLLLIFTHDFSIGLSRFLSLKSRKINHSIVINS